MDKHSDYWFFNKTVCISKWSEETFPYRISTKHIWLYWHDLDFRKIGVGLFYTRYGSNFGIHLEILSNVFGLAYHGEK